MAQAFRALARPTPSVSYFLTLALTFHHFSHRSGGLVFILLCLVTLCASLGFFLKGGVSRWVRCLTFSLLFPLLQLPHEGKNSD